MKLHQDLIDDVAAALDVISRGDSLPSWIKAAARVLEISGREIREAVNAALEAEAKTKTNQTNQP